MPTRSGDFGRTFDMLLTLDLAEIEVLIPGRFRKMRVRPYNASSGCLIPVTFRFETAGR